MSQSADLSANSAPTSPQFAATLQRAFVYAEEQAHRLVSAEHLMLALTEDPDAVAVFQRKNIDLDHLRNEIASLVSRNNDRFAYGDTGQPIYGSDLLRVLTTAGGAASARRPIDGALVLAAIIADGRTPAAELIRIYGLTFEDASRGNRPTLPPFVPPAVAAAAPGAPSLTSLRTSARESALGLRKRQQAADADGEAIAPLPPPLQLPPEDVPKTVRPVTSLRRPPAAPPQMQPPEPQAADWNAAPARHQNGAAYGEPAWPAPAQQTNGAWAEPEPAPPVPSPQPRYEQPAAEQAYRHQGFPQQKPQWDAAPPPQQAQPQWDEPAYPESYRQDATGYADETAAPAYDERPPAAPAQPQKRVRRADETAAAAPAPHGKTHGRKSGRPRQKAERGLLVENIPRRMQVGVAVMVEARIARHDVEAALADMAGPGTPTAHAIPITQAMAVRLRSMDGGMTIESGSPETQWVDGALGLLDDDYASWRWTVTPKWAGATTLQLVVSARSIADDGLSAEVGLPDQNIDVKVNTNYGLMMRGVVRWTGVAVAAGGLGAIGEHALNLIGKLLGH